MADRGDSLILVDGVSGAGVRSRLQGDEAHHHQQQTQPAQQRASRQTRDGMAASGHTLTALSLSAFITTETDDALMAKAANIGLMRMPKKGNSSTAATGTPAAL